MSGRQSAAMDRALALVDQGQTLYRAAQIAGVNLRSLRRAVRRREAQAEGKPGAKP